MGRLSAEDRHAIAEAVGRAETGTTGEIVCILTQEVSEYREVPLGWATAAALVLPFLAAMAGYHPALHLAALTGSAWQAGGTSGSLDALAVVGAYAALQGLMFAAVFFVALIPSVRRTLTPASLKRHRVLKAATTQFVATGLTTAADRTGVVIFASLHDRRVEVLADKAIHDAVGDAVWEQTAQAVQDGMRTGRGADGFVRAVEICGAALAQHFPATGPRANALSDEILEL